MTIYNHYYELRSNFSALGTTATDGFKTWDDSLYDSAGTIGTLSMPTNPSTLTFPFTVTINNGAADSVAWTDEYDWYLSEPGKANGRTARLSIARSDDGGGTTNSGRVSIDRVDSVLELDRLFFAAFLFVRRKSDGLYQVGDFFESLFSEVP